jgi:hypothetical protein
MDALPQMRSDWFLKVGLRTHEDGQRVQFARARIASDASGAKCSLQMRSLGWATQWRGAHESIGKPASFSSVHL